MTLYAMIVAATMVGMFDFCKMAKSGLEKRQIGKKRKEADERHATLFSFYCLPLRYILTPGVIVACVGLRDTYILRKYVGKYVLGLYPSVFPARYVLLGKYPIPR